MSALLSQELSAVHYGGALQASFYCDGAIDERLGKQVVWVSWLVPSGQLIKNGTVLPCLSVCYDALIVMY